MQYKDQNFIYLNICETSAIQPHMIVLFWAEEVQAIQCKYAWRENVNAMGWKMMSEVFQELDLV